MFDRIMSQLGRATKAVLATLVMASLLWFELVVALPGLIIQFHDDGL